MLPENLHRTLLFASALQVLGGDHAIAKLLQQAVQRGDEQAWQIAEKAIKALSEDERQVLMERYDQLCEQLPREAFAA